MSEQSAYLEFPNRSWPQLRPTLVAILVAVALAVLLLCTSPNFSSIEGERVSPYSGDFLQEWVGGYIVNSSDSHLLYDLDHFKSVQHDSTLIKFEWDQEKYYPPIYSPGYYLLMAPLTWTSYKTASIIWLIFSVTCFALTWILLYHFHPSGKRMGWVAPIVAAVFAPLLFSLNIGHKSLFILLVFTATYLLCYHRRLFWAGCCAGLIGFKPHFLIVLAVVMLIRRDWQFLGGLCVAALGWTGLCLVAGPDLFIQYLQIIAGSGDYLSNSGYQLEQAHSLFSNAELSLGWLGVSGCQTVAGLAGLGVLIWLGLNSRKTSDLRSLEFSRIYSAIIIATVLLSPHFYQYDLTILILPLLLSFWFSAPQRDSTRRILFTLLTGFFLLAGSFPLLAETTSIQFSFFFLVGWLILLFRANHEPATASEAPPGSIRTI